MNAAAIQAVALTFGEFGVLVIAAGPGHTAVRGASLRAARNLEAKGLGAVGPSANPAESEHTFTINEAGRDQVRIRQ